MVWSKPAARNTLSTRRLSIGGHIGMQVAGDPSRARIGAQLTSEIKGPVELTMGFNVIGDFPEASTRASGSGWQFMINFKLRPLGEETPWYLGTGITALRTGDDATSNRPGFGVGEKDVNTFHVLLAGVTLPVGRRTRPFVEVQVLDAFSNATAHAFVGFHVRVR